MCKGSFVSPNTLDTPTETIVPLGTHRASSLPTDTMEQRITYARVKSRLTIQALSAHMSIHKDYYRIIEQKADRIGVDHLMLFCSATGADPSWIIYGNNAPPMLPLSSSTVGKRMREFRTVKQITCKALAQQAFGCQKLSSISKWETDRMSPELRTLMRISSAYGFNVLSFIPAVAYSALAESDQP